MDATADPTPAGAVGPAAGDLIRRLEGDHRLDAVAARLQGVADDLLPPGPARDRWRGAWLGHPLHPMLTDVPIGMWTSAFVLDLVGGRAGRRAADRLIALGVAAAVPTAVAGAAELAEAHDGATRRVGAAHALGNAGGTLLYALSWRARRRGRRLRGLALSLAGAGVLSASGYLGGHLAYGRGMGVGAFGPARPGKVGRDDHDYDEESTTMAKTVADVMMPDPVTCPRDARIQDAAQLMREHEIGDVVVVDDGHVQGIVTDRDLVVRGLASGADATTRLQDVLSGGVVSVAPGAAIEQAVQLMRERAVRRLPVVDGERLVGIVSIGDLAMDRDPDSALADISAAPANT